MATGTDLRSVPTFLGIGAQKAGTTWLATNLRQHPDIWMPPRKELHYFDRSPEYPSPSVLYPDNPFRRLFGAEPYNARSRREMSRALVSSLRRLDSKRLAWNARYYLGSCDDDWYVSLFKDGRDKITGEITPAYSLLEKEDVANVYRLLPTAKIIYLIRNPVDRAWSQLRFEAKKKNRSLETLTFENVRERAHIASHHLRGDYLRTLANWQTYFPQEQLFVGFFDDIEEKPWDILKMLFEFLGLDVGKYPIAEYTFDKVNVSPEKKMPDQVRAFLSEKYLDEVRQINEMVGGHAQAWLAEMEQALATEPGRSNE